ncbi:MAG: hypothetical protein Q8L55_07430 [Phycisphaerales bacterium]|nr:hypothetical protein [Phycisphaerales bacterium]
MNFNDHNGSRAVEQKLHAMRGDAARAPDLTAGIISRLETGRPFADTRTLHLRRWGRLAAMGCAVGLALCGGLVALQWRQIAPGLAEPHPVAGVVGSAVADVRASGLAIRDAQERLTRFAMHGQARTDLEDTKVVRAIAANVIVPMSELLQVPPSLEPSETERNLAQRMLASGQRMLSRAERVAAAAFRPGTGGAGAAGLNAGAGSETFADRLGRAIGGVPLSDGGPQ